MIPRVFVQMLQRAGASKSLAKKTWGHLRHQLSQSTMFHLLRLQESATSLEYVIDATRPSLLLSALEKAGPPSGQRRPPEQVTVEQALLAEVDAHGRWK